MSSRCGYAWKYANPRPRSPRVSRLQLPRPRPPPHRRRTRPGHAPRCHPCPRGRCLRCRRLLRRAARPRNLRSDPRARRRRRVMARPLHLRRRRGGDHRAGPHLHRRGRPDRRARARHLLCRIHPRPPRGPRGSRQRSAHRHRPRPLLRGCVGESRARNVRHAGLLHPAHPIGDVSRGGGHGLVPDPVTVFTFVHVSATHIGKVPLNAIEYAGIYPPNREK